jgi:ATP-binding protein involved in chromosome partitioning
MAAQTRQRITGVVENMSWLVQPDGSRLELFGAGGGENVAATLTRTLGSDVPLLGQVPLDVRLRIGGDVGVPLVLSDPEADAAVAMRAVARSLSHRARGLAGRSLGLSPV